MKVVSEMSVRNIAPNFKLNTNVKVNTVLNEKIVPEGNRPSSFQQVLESLTSVSRSWQRAQSLSMNKIEKLPSQSRSLFELQLLVQKLDIETGVLTKSAEAVSGSIRRLQQLGGN